MITNRGDEGEIIELLWQNGQVVLQSQNQRSAPPLSFKKSTSATGGSSGGGGGGGIEGAEIPSQQPQSTPKEIQSFDNDMINNMSNQHPPQQLFMQEDEMASWLHYPIPMDDSSFVDHRDLYPDDLLYPPPSAPTAAASPPNQIRSIVTEIRPPAPPPSADTSTATIAPRPSIPLPPVPEASAAPPPPKFQNFSHFARLPQATRISSGPSNSDREVTMVDSSETPIVGTKSRVPQPAVGHSSDQLLSGGNVTESASIPAVGNSTAAGEMAEQTVTSSPGASGGSASASASVEPPPPAIHNPSTAAAEDRKRKGRETDDTECQSEVQR